MQRSEACWGNVHVARLELAIGPLTHLCHVVRAASLGARSHDGLLPPAEGLALNNRTGDAAVDVGIAHLNVVDPVLNLGVVKRVNAAGQAIAGVILPGNSLFQGIGVHDAQDGAEALVLVVPRARLHIIADARGPQGAFLVELFRLEQPLLARLELGQTAQELLARRFRQTVHGGSDIEARARLKGLDRVQQLGAQALGLAGRADEDNQGGRRTLLAGVAKGGVVEVIDGQIRVRGWGDDERVLAGSLRHNVHLRLPRTEERAGIGGAGEDDIVHVIVREQGLAGRGFISQHQLHQVRI